jgi:hypothetical protein
MSSGKNFLVAQGQLLRTIPIKATGEAEQIKSSGEPTGYRDLRGWAFWTQCLRTTLVA